MRLLISGISAGIFNVTTYHFFFLCGSSLEGSQIKLSAIAIHCNIFPCPKKGKSGSLLI